MHLQVPSGGQVLNGAQASALQQQLHPVDCERGQAVSSSPHHGLPHSAGSAPSWGHFGGRQPPWQALCPPDSHTTPTATMQAPRVGLAQRLVNGDNSLREAPSTRLQEEPAYPSVHPTGVSCTSSVPGTVLGAGRATVSKTVQHPLRQNLVWTGGEAVSG